METGKGAQGLQLCANIEQDLAELAFRLLR